MPVVKCMVGVHIRGLFTIFIDKREYWYVWEFVSSYI